MKRILVFTKRNDVFALICFSFVFSAAIRTVDAQPVNDTYLLLSDYTYTADDQLIGTINVHAAGGASSGDNAKFVLRGENAGKFKIRKGNQLFIRGKYAKSPEKWFDVSIGTEDGQLNADFKVLKDEFHDNGVIAHRGAWKNTHVPQNSIASFKKAAALGCEGSEFDVHLTGDSVTVLFHDRQKDGLVIEEKSYAELSEKRLENGEVLPTLTDFLREGMSQHTTKMILEIKPSAVSKERGIALTDLILSQVREAGAQGWVDYISFGYDICQRVLELDPFANVAYLNGDKAPADVAPDRLYGLDYNLKVFRKNPGWVREAKDNGLTLNVWTVNAAEDMDWFLEQGFDFITTDEPELLLKKTAEK